MKEEQIKTSTYLPKYQKVYHYILDKIKNNDWESGSKLPSIIELSIELDLSKDTISKAYQELLENKIIKSVPRRGYFVNKDLKTEFKSKVLLIISDVTFENKSIYDELLEKLKNKAELFTYCCFDNNGIMDFLRNSSRDFDYFILSPFNAQINCDLHQIVDLIPFNKQLYINYKNDDHHLFDLDILGDEIFSILRPYKDRINSYNRFNLVLPENHNFYYQTIKGFQKFCDCYQLDYSLLDGIVPEEIFQNEIYFVLDNDELFELVKVSRKKQLEFGYDIGVLSLNENPYKEFIANGISTIQFNFEEITENFCSAILNGIKQDTYLRLKLIDRNSF